MSRIRPPQTWQQTVQEVYATPAELRAYDRIYGTVRRCGYRSVKRLWEENPRIGGSVNPRAFGLARSTP